MKKLIAVLFVLILLSSSVVAESIDLSSIPDTELLELYSQVETELTARDLLHEHLFVGDYYGGEDLQPGRYVLSVVEAYDSKYSGVYVEAQVYELNPTTKEWKRIYAEDLHHPGEKCSFTLKEGQRFSVRNGEYEIISFKKN